MNTKQIDILQNRKNEIFQLSRDNETYEVDIESSITLEDYRSITLEKDWSLLQEFVRDNQGKKVVFINPTMAGGGVAMLRPPLVHMLRCLGVDAHWFVMEPFSDHRANPFIFTKQMHNILQRQAPEDERITTEGKLIHQRWNDENAKVLINQPAIKSADVIVIDDPQPAPLKKYLEKVNPNAKWLWRNHIDTDGSLMADPSTPQGEIAEYIFKECGIGDVDAIINHPVEQFIHPDFDDKTYFAPATIEPFDGLNRQLSDAEIQEGIDFINQEIALKNAEFERAGRAEDIQQFLDTNRRRIMLVARFDESKGMDKAMELGVAARDLMSDKGVGKQDLPQIILIGNGSVDDPSGIPMFEEMLQLRRQAYPDCKEDIILMRLKHNYMAVNAIMYPKSQADGSFSGRELVAMQTSEAEGFETRITDWLRHGVPVVISNRGGMQLQVVEGQSGVVLDYDKPDRDIDKGAKFIADLMMDETKYEEVRQSTLDTAKSFNSREFTTVSNAIRWLRIFSHIYQDIPADKRWKISEITKTDGA
ncbi:MAG: hypothetical protein WD061_03645 [Candidatus Saccharimonadales bacterium]